MLNYLSALPPAVAQGMIWGIMAIGVYITYKILDIADLTVDGSICTGAAVCAVLMARGCSVWIALLGVVCEEYIEIVLDDHGPGIKDIEQAMQAGYSTATENIRSLGFGAGMGLPNMKKNTDSMEIKSTLGVGTRITMRINL